METRSPNLLTTLQPTSQRTAELDRLGDEIAELSARLDVGWAIDVLHPLATRNVRSIPSPDGRGP
jgi:hypothetical protein